ncbi:MAG: hypothetical protein QM765_25385 [Myxococcales bacterium]
MKTVVLAVLAAVPLAACGASGSSGRCDGRIGSTSLSGPINANTARWHWLASKTRVALVFRYANDQLRIEGEFRPESSTDGLGTFPLPVGAGSTGRVASWDIMSPTQRPQLASGTLTFDGWGEELSGSFKMVHQEGSELKCTFKLQHDPEADVL